MTKKKLSLLGQEPTFKSPYHGLTPTEKRQNSRVASPTSDEAERRKRLGNHELTMSAVISHIYKDVESRALELEDQIRCLKQLFRPWPPPGSKKEENSSPKEDKSEVPEAPPPEVIPAGEQAELDRIEKLLNKAKIARNNAHKKNLKELQMKDIQKEDVQNSVSSKQESSKQEGKCISDKGTEGNEKDTQPVIKKKTLQEIILMKGISQGSNTKNPSRSLVNNTRKPDNVTAVSKPASVKSERTNTVSARSTSSKTERPGSSSGKRKLVPAHISAPFQTNPNLRTSKMQTTYSSATSVKSTLRGQGRESSVKKSGVGSGGSARVSQSTSIKPGSAGPRQDTNKFSAKNTNSKAACDNSNQNNSGIDSKINDKFRNDTVQEIKQSICKGDGTNGNNAGCNNLGDVKVINDRVCETVIKTSTVISDNSGEVNGGKEDGMDIEDESDKLFDLKKDGSTIELPIKLRKYLSQNTKLRQKYQTQMLTRKVDSPRSVHSFSSLLTHVEKYEDNTKIQSMVKQAENITNIYKHLLSLLESLHLDQVTADSPPSELLHSKRHLEFLLTDYQETEELFHRTDFRLLRSVPTCEKVSHPKTEKTWRSPVIWYNKFSGIPGHRSAETVIYNSYKDLERYRSLVFKNQWMSAQLEVMDSSAELVLPVLRTLDPTSSEFLSALRCGYELLLMTSNTSPVIVKDTIDEDL